jgi:hypothetical protein
MAGSCQDALHKNPNLLPHKWAKTSVVIVLQHPHNLKVEIPAPAEAQTINADVCHGEREVTTNRHRPDGLLLR